jgi:ankyrin repeat protein
MDGARDVRGKCRGEKSVQTLLNAGADLTFKSKKGQTALAIAREHDEEGLIKMLESRGAPE